MKTTMNGDLLATTETHLLRLGRWLAEEQARLEAARLIAVGAMTENGTNPVNPDWFSADEHLRPILEAAQQVSNARLAIRKAVREIQETNPIPARPCGDYQHEGSPEDDDRPCTKCGGSGYVAGLASEAAAVYGPDGLERGPTS